MKKCLQCAATYNDDLAFCLNDGSTLVDGANSPQSSAADQLPPTMFVRLPSEPTRYQDLPPNLSAFAPNIGTTTNHPQRPSFTSRQIAIGIGGVLIGLLVLAGAIGGILYFAANDSSGKTKTVASTNNSPANFGGNSPAGNNSRNANVKTLPPGNFGNNSNPNSVSNTDTNADSADDGSEGLSDFIPSETAGFTRTSDSLGDAVKDGFPGALEERQYKYSKGGNFALHVTGVLYASPEKAQGALRTLHEEWKRKGLDVGEIDDQQTDAGKVDGIGFSVSTKKGFYVYVKTENEYLVRALGDQDDVNKFINSF